MFMSLVIEPTKLLPHWVNTAAPPEAPRHPTNACHHLGCWHRAASSPSRRLLEQRRAVPPSPRVTKRSPFVSASHGEPVTGCAHPRLGSAGTSP